MLYSILQWVLSTLSFSFVSVSCLKSCQATKKRLYKFVITLMANGFVTKATHFDHTARAARFLIPAFVVDKMVEKMMSISNGDGNPTAVIFQGMKIYYHEAYRYMQKRARPFHNTKKFFLSFLCISRRKRQFKTCGWMAKKFMWSWWNMYIAFVLILTMSLHLKQKKKINDIMMIVSNYG